MTKGQFAVALVALVLAGLVGGGASEALFNGRTALAQQGPASVIEAQEFRLVDEAGNIRAASATFPDGSVSLAFYDQGPRSRLGLGAGSDGRPFVVLWDEKGDLVWSAPRG